LTKSISARGERARLNSLVEAAKSVRSERYAPTVGAAAAGMAGNPARSHHRAKSIQSEA